MKNIGFAALTGLFVGVLFGIAVVPAGAEPIRNFEKEKYLGKWYEIARFDFAFERDLSNTTAEYGVLPNGYIGVTNRGFNYKKNRWTEAKGKARFKGSDTVAELEVSFFGPFYAAYNVIALDDSYRYALVLGGSPKYLWILSREPTIPDDVKQSYLKIAEAAGCDTSKLIWVDHGDPQR